MRPPSAICRSLYRLHPQLRLAWAGRPPNNDKELNPGSFALVQLYHISDVGRTDDPSTYRQLWDVEVFEVMPGKTEQRRLDRGPIFNKDGGVSRDWDPLTRVPIFVATLDESYGVGLNDISTGKVMQTISEWAIPIQRRMREAARLKGLRLKSEVDDLSRAISSEVIRKSNETDQATVIQANKHCKDDLKRAYATKDTIDDRLEGMFDLPE